MKSPVNRTFMALVGVGILLSFTLWFVAHQQRVSDLRWCALIVSLDNRYQNLPASPVPSAEALELANAIHQLRDELHCPPSVLHLAPNPSPS